MVLCTWSEVEDSFRIDRSGEWGTGCGADGAELVEEAEDRGIVLDNDFRAVLVGPGGVEHGEEEHGVLAGLNLLDVCKGEVFEVLGELALSELEPIGEVEVVVGDPFSDDLARDRDRGFEGFEGFGGAADGACFREGGEEGLLKSGGLFWLPAVQLRRHSSDPRGVLI